MKKKVLMLGWEFPPIINGGLGVAALGISKALSEYVDLTIILPKTDPSFILQNVNLIGLNNMDLRKMYVGEDKTELYKSFSQAEYVDINLDPYYNSTETRTLMLTEEEEERIKHDENLMLEKFFNIFYEGELYGEDVIQKVILFSKYVLKLASKKEFDIIYAHDWMTFLAGLEIKFKTGKPLALHVHALDYDRSGPDSRGWIYELEKYGMENADLIIPVSEYTASVIINHYGIDPSKVVPVHNGAEDVVPYHLEKSFPEKLVLFLGRVTGQKGPEFFLEVASQVFEQYKKVRFVVAGTGDKLKRLIETGAYRQIGHKFHFTGFLDKQKVERLLAMTDVYCMPSVSEPFGLSALEAAQFGIPMVISNQSGVAEVLRGALKADYWDVNLMATHIVSLLKDKRLGNKLVKTNYEDLKNLSWANSGKQIYEAFSKIA